MPRWSTASATPPLSHGAFGAADDVAPTWLTEGLAEYVGATPVPVADRVIASVALARSRLAVAGMLSSAEFNGADQEWHYALSWMPCDHIASTAGEEALWRLLEELSAGGRPGLDDGQDVVLQRVLGSARRSWLGVRRPGSRTSTGEPGRPD